ncbi:hypothetical protein LGM35_14570 [Burkholderia cenocepacia]|uniref:hypothetical protein n=1 Tax=Burkholderia cenocepacia TaxID=95486 RepID=UPI001CF52D9D|nr:hypothetical protein [Burkholderia cenocepacia]MCA7923708.1 hypothetical protein [Burkholderia cenocepacia]
MDEQQRLAVFKAQTTNVQELESAWKHINRQINALILDKNHKAVEISEKILALIYCALAESLFSKLIHTPHGLPLDEIRQIKDAVNADGVKEGWIKCAEFSMKRVGGAKSNHSPNVLQKLRELINRYIFDPSVVRNKLAHGQWSIALNRHNTAVNDQITKQIEEHNVVELYRRLEALKKLAVILEDIVESPNKAHHRDYWTHLTQFEETQRKLADWTMDKKVEQLFAKKARMPKQKHCCSPQEVGV